MIGSARRGTLEADCGIAHARRRCGSRYSHVGHNQGLTWSPKAIMEACPRDCRIARGQFSVAKKYPEAETVQFFASMSAAFLWIGESAAECLSEGLQRFK